MSNKQIDLTLKNTNVPQSNNQKLRIGEPFYYESTKDLLIGNGQKDIKDIAPVRANMAVGMHSKDGTVHTFTINSLIGNTPDFSFATQFTANGVTGDTVKLVFTNGNTSYTPEVSIDFKSPIDGIKTGRLNIVFVHLFSADSGVAFLPFYNSSGDICIIQGIANPYQGGEVMGTGAYHAGDPVTLSATANTGYTFSKWSDDDTSNPKEFTATGNVSYVAKFEATRHTITINTSTGGSVTPNPISGPDGKYPYGTIITLTATPGPGYRFDRWDEDNNPNSERQITVTGDATYTAIFVKVYTVTISAGTGGTVRIKDETSWGTTVTKAFDENTVIDIEAHTNTGYDFDQWSDGDVTDHKDNVTITSDLTLSATFSVKSFTISTNVSPAGGGTVTGAGTYNYGSAVTLEATPEPGYSFVRWTKGSSTVTLSTNTTYTFTATENATYNAEFYLIPTTHHITVEVNNDVPTRGLVRIVGPAIDTGWGTSVSEDIDIGEQGVEIYASSSTGYSFLQWSDGNSQNPREIAIDNDATYTAQFSVNQYIIQATANPSAGGTVTGSNTYNYGATATLTAQARQNYAFLRWTKNGVQVSTNPTYSFTVEASATVQEYVAHFTYGSALYVFNVEADPTNGGTVSGGNTYPENELVTLRANPASGWYFDKWMKNGSDFSTDPTIIVYANSATAGNYVAYFTQGTSYTVYAGSQVMGLSVTPIQAVFTSPPSTPITYTISKENYTYGGHTYKPVIADGVTPCGYFELGQTIEDIDSIREWARIEEGDDDLYDIIPLAGAKGLKSYSISDGSGTNISYVVLIPSPVALSAGGTGGSLSETTKSLPTNLSDTTFTLSNVSLDGGTVLVDYDNYPTYTVTVNGGNYGTATKTPNLQSYLAGSQVVIRCTPISGYAFVRWSDGNTENPRTVIINQSATYTAVVGQIVNITTGSTPDGAGTTQGESQYVVQKSATIKSIPYTNQNYFFDYWTIGANGNVASYDANYTFTVTGASRYMAHCLQATHQVQWPMYPTFSQSDEDDNELWSIYQSYLLISSKFVSDEKVFNKISIGEYGEITYSYVVNGVSVRSIEVFDANGQWLSTAYRTVKFVDNPSTIVNNNFDWSSCFAYNGLTSLIYTTVVSGLPGVQIAPTSGTYSGSPVTLSISKHQAYQTYNIIISNGSNVLTTINTSAGETVDDSQGHLTDWARLDNEGDEQFVIPILNTYGIKQVLVINSVDGSTIRTIDVIVVPRDCRISTTNGLLTQGQLQGSSINLTISNFPVNVTFSNAYNAATITLTRR